MAIESEILLDGVEMQTANSLERNLKTDQTEPEPVFILTSSQLQAIISEAIEESTRSLRGDISHLQDTIAGQEARMGRLQQFIEIVYEKLPDPIDISIAEAYKRQRNLLWNVSDRTYELDDMIKEQLIPIIKTHDLALKKLQTGPSSLSAGKATRKRITEVERLLKANDGSMSFKSLRAKMDLEPNQLTRLIESLDRRSFEVVQNPRAKKEKILRIKVR